jgi:ABC-type dipeptide/oligopeptide/nickel transport system permease component
MVAYRRMIRALLLRFAGEYLANFVEGSVARPFRGGIIEAPSRDYVRTARAKGCARTINIRHAAQQRADLSW